MGICLKHSQQYNQDEFCPYCGNPQITVNSNDSISNEGYFCICAGQGWTDGIGRTICMTCKKEKKPLIAAI